MSFTHINIDDIKSTFIRYLYMIYINTMLVIYEKNKYLLIMNFLMNLFCHILKIEVIKKNSYHSQ